MKYDSIIGILTYKGHFLKGCIESIVNTVTDFEKNAIVIANNSEDENYIAEVEAIVRATHTNVSTLNFRRNRGTSAAWNTIARSYDAQNVAIFNDDILMWGGWYETMVRYLAYRPIGVMGLMLSNGWKEWDYRNTISPEEALRQVYFQHLIWPSGSCLFFRQSVFCEIGGFDEKLWTGFEEVDFSMRAMQLGYFNIQAGVEGDIYRFGNHYGGGTEYKMKDAASEIRKHNEASEDYYFKKYGYAFPPNREHEEQLKAIRDQKAKDRGFSL